MNITLSKELGLRGTDTTKAWTASVLNDNGEVVLRGRAISANGALREVERQLEEALQSVKEMRGRSDPPVIDQLKTYQG